MALVLTITVAIAWIMMGYLGRSIIYSTSIYEGFCDPYPPLTWVFAHLICGPFTLASGIYIALDSCCRHAHVMRLFKAYGILFEHTTRALCVENGIYGRIVSGQNKRK